MHARGSDSHQNVWFLLTSTGNPEGSLPARLMVNSPASPGLETLVKHPCIPTPRCSQLVFLIFFILPSGPKNESSMDHVKGETEGFFFCCLLFGLAR